MDKCSKAKRIAAVCMSMCLAALCAVAILADIHISVRIFAVFSSIFGFFELYRWVKK